MVTTRTKMCLCFHLTMSEWEKCETTVIDHQHATVLLQNRKITSNDHRCENPLFLCHKLYNQQSFTFYIPSTRINFNNIRDEMQLKFFLFFAKFIVGFLLNKWVTSCVRRVARRGLWDESTSLRFFNANFNGFLKC